ncbi:DUF305 domain-containing protein [Pseudoroseomonas globiformis]|uniref:DUF305 domain-containing protein n=1 Tax=Teichococcus globiformis TaxID=2307229 RepID=A0ABV7FZ50_9PROT
MALGWSGLRRGTMLALLLATSILTVPFLAPAAARAEMGPADPYDPDGRNTPATTTWWDLGEAAQVEAGRQADLAYVRGMRPHHAGALTLSRDYLADPEARNPVLRRLAAAIIPNQAFEIALLDEVGRQAEQPVTALGPWSMRPMATEGMGARLRYQPTPPSGVLALLSPAQPIGARDVRFAKEMAVHHQAALRMARDFNADPASRNGYLKLLNIDIVTDQSQEIALMERVIAAYPGDAAAIVIDAASIPGMEHMMHGGQGHGHHGHASPPAPEGEHTRHHPAGHRSGSHQSMGHGGSTGSHGHGSHH